MILKMSASTTSPNPKEISSQGHSPRAEDDAVNNGHLAPFSVQKAQEDALRPARCLPTSTCSLKSSKLAAFLTNSCENSLNGYNLPVIQIR